MNILYKLAWLFTLVGALNWGLIGLFDLNLVHSLLGALPSVEKIIYIVIGASALVSGLMYFSEDHSCHRRS